MKTYLFYKIVQGVSPQYLIKSRRSNCVPNYQTWAANKNSFEKVSYRIESFKYSFFTFCLRKWEHLGISMREAKSIKQFESLLMVFHIKTKIAIFNTWPNRYKITFKVTLHTKWRFPLWISSVNEIKSAGNCGFGHIYCRNP